MQTLLPQFINKDNPTGAEPVPDAALWNDTQNLTVLMEPGKTYFFRVINIGAFAGQYVWFEGHNMTIIEVDGIYTEKAEAQAIYLGAAQRCSFLITARNDTSQNFPFVASMDTVSSPSIPFESTILMPFPIDPVRYSPRYPELECYWLAPVFYHR